MKTPPIASLALTAALALSACTTIIVRPDGTVVSEDGPAPAVAPEESGVQQAPEAEAARHHAGGRQYPAAIRNVFLEKCTPEAGAASCECVLGKMEAEFSVEDLGANKVSTADIQRWTSECLGVPADQIPIPDAEPVVEPYPQEVRDLWLNSCTPEAGRAACECVLEKMERTISLDRLARQELPKEQLEAWVQECRGG